MLGKREAEHYGTWTLSQIEEAMVSLGKELGLDVSAYQSNIEGELVTRVQQCANGNIDGIVINPGAYGHTSIALRDAFKIADVPFIEVHMSNIHAREEFRHKTYLSDISSGVVVGFGTDSYLLGLRGLAAQLNKRKSK